MCPMDGLTSFTFVGGKGEPAVGELSNEWTWDITLPQRVTKPWDEMEEDKRCQSIQRPINQFKGKRSQRNHMGQVRELGGRVEE